MDVQNIVLECVQILSLQNNPVEAFSDLANIELIGSLVNLINTNEEVDWNIAVISSEVNSLFNEYFSSGNLTDIDSALNGNNVELCILYLLLIYISLLANANLRNRFFSSPMSLSTELKLTYLMERIQEKSAISHTDLKILVQRNLDFVIDSTSENKGDASPQLRSVSPSFKFQSPLSDYLKSPSFTSQRRVEEKNREIKNLRQQIYNLEVEKQDLQDENAVITRKREKTEKDRNSISLELKSLMKEYEESTSAALQDEQEDKKLVVHCQTKIKCLESENKTISVECSKMSEEYNELFKKCEALQKEVTSVSAEKLSLCESNRSLQQVNFTNETLLEEQSSELNDIKSQLEELRRYFQEQKSYCNTLDESFDIGSSQDTSQECQSDTIGENSTTLLICEEKRLQPKDMQLELMAKNNIITNLTAECQQLTSQVTVAELELQKKEKCCDSFKLRIENLSSQLEVSRKINTSNQQNTLSNHNNDVNKNEDHEIISKNKYLLKEIDNLQDKNNTFQTKFSQLKEAKEKMSQKVERIESLNTEHAEKYEKILEENRSLLEKIIRVKDEKEDVQILLNNLKEEKYSSSNENSSFEDKLTTISVENGRLQKELDSLQDKVAKKDDLLQSHRDKVSLLNEENAKLSKEVERCQQKLISYKDGSVDSRTEILSAKEDAFKVERDLQKTIDSLTTHLQSSTDKNASDKRIIERMKASFSSEMQKVLDHVAELESIGKDNEILKQKYDSSKRTVYECKDQLQMATSNNKRMELELNEVRIELVKYRKAHRQSSVRLDTLQEERQPLQCKLAAVENKLKRVVTEKNALTTQLAMAETTLQEQNKVNKRASFMQSGTNRRLRSAEQSCKVNSDEYRKNVRFDKENDGMIAPLPPGKKSFLRPASTVQANLKKTSSEANFSMGHQSKAALLVRTKSMTGSSYNFNAPSAAMPLTASVVNEEESDGEFVDARRSCMAMEEDLEVSLDWRRMSELQRRNSLYPPHMRSAYTAEMQYKSTPFSEDDIRTGDPDQVLDTVARGYNLRKRSIEYSEIPADRKTRRLTEVRSRTQLPKAEVWEIPLESDSKRKPSTSSTPHKLLRETRHGLSPANRVRRTPSSLSRILRSGRSPWKKYQEKNEDGSSSSEASRKKIFRNPFGSKNYNVRSASQKNEAPTS